MALDTAPAPGYAVPVLEYSSLVRAIVSSLPVLHADAEDLYQSGMLALAEAAERWDPERGFTLGAFARRAAHGAIVRANTPAGPDHEPLDTAGNVPMLTEVDLDINRREFEAELTEPELKVWRRNIYAVKPLGIRPLAVELGMTERKLTRMVTRIRDKLAAYRKANG